MFGIHIVCTTIINGFANQIEQIGTCICFWIPHTLHIYASAAIHYVANGISSPNADIYILCPRNHLYVFTLVPRIHYTRVTLFVNHAMVLNTCMNSLGIIPKSRKLLAAQSIPY